MDPSLGVLLELPSGQKDAPPAAAYVHVSNLSDEKTDKPEKAFKSGLKVSPAGI